MSDRRGRDGQRRGGTELGAAITVSGFWRSEQSITSVFGYSLCVRVYVERWISVEVKLQARGFAFGPRCEFCFEARLVYIAFRNT